MQAMEGSLTDSNRQRCAEASKPLLHAVETLITFAESPEFASIPATVSEKVRRIFSIVLPGHLL